VLARFWPPHGSPPPAASHSGRPEDALASVRSAILLGAVVPDLQRPPSGRHRPALPGCAAQEQERSAPPAPTPRRSWKAAPAYHFFLSERAARAASAEARPAEARRRLPTRRPACATSSPLGAGEPRRGRLRRSREGVIARENSGGRPANRWARRSDASVAFVNARPAAHAGQRRAVLRRQ
jgi:hypothetical protein